MMVGSYMEKDVLCGSHVVWALEAQAPGLSSLVISLHMVGTQCLHSHKQRGCSGLGKTSRATSRPQESI